MRVYGGEPLHGTAVSIWIATWYSFGWPLNLEAGE